MMFRLLIISAILFHFIADIDLEKKHYEKSVSTRETLLFSLRDSLLRDW